MYKNLLIILILIAAAAAVSGCITEVGNNNTNTQNSAINNADGHDKIIGTWTTNDYISDLGVHYTKVVDEFHADNTMDQTLYLEDGSSVAWKATWIYNSDGSYNIYYIPFTLLINNNGKRSMVNCNEFGIDDLRFDKITEGENVTGVWRNPESYPFSEGFEFVEIEAKKDGTAVIKFIGSDSGKSAEVYASWYELGRKSYVFTISHDINAVIENDGKLHDNTGYIYTRI